MALEMMGNLDLWSLFVYMTFGSFWAAVIGLALLFFIILGPIGKVSTYTMQLYLIIFVFTMGMGYAYAWISMLITLAIWLGVLYSGMGYVNRGAQ